MVVILFVPAVSACLYQWDPDRPNMIENTEMEMSSLREFVMQPLPNPAFIERNLD